jgi:magnesium chelatase family protein
VLGIDAYLVDVEIDISNGLPSFTTVGLPQGAVKEGRERVGASIANSEFLFPLKRITVNLAPADIRKEGSAFDLPIALGILAATQQLNPKPQDSPTPPDSRIMWWSVSWDWRGDCVPSVALYP